eukprot:TRINITY_DN20196_c0_g1_i2.p1 TRINITY_DN20196_c0_g1~~TRINITY_DN20196_c0_g1_i2.p1  ORF type:complete len:245 (+),score=49.81 TRINITY_DN20196_c0_g1_i2:114-848(+)
MIESSLPDDCSTNHAPVNARPSKLETDFSSPQDDLSSPPSSPSFMRLRVPQQQLDPIFDYPYPIYRIVSFEPADVASVRDLAEFSDGGDAQSDSSSIFWSEDDEIGELCAPKEAELEISPTSIVEISPMSNLSPMTSPMSEERERALVIEAELQLVAEERKAGRRQSWMSSDSDYSCSLNSSLESMEPFPELLAGLEEVQRRVEGGEMAGTIEKAKGKLGQGRTGELVALSEAMWALGTSPKDS